MDLKEKGITWVGNIYHTFEAIRSEVEDMSKETAKYVENQVQGVGVNVKKICEDVMHDLLPSSSVDSVKEEYFDTFAEQIADLGTFKESMAALEDNPSKTNAPDKVLEITAPLVKVSAEVSFSTGVPNKFHLFPPSSVGPVKHTGPDFSLEQNDDIYKPKKDVPTKENETRENFKITVPTVKDASLASFSNCVYNVNDLFLPSSASLVKDATPDFPLEQNEDFDKLKKSNTGIEDEVVKEDPPQLEVSEVIASDGRESNQTSWLSCESNDPAVEVLSRVFSTQTEMSPQTSVDFTVESSSENGGDVHSNTLDRTGHIFDSSIGLPSSILVPSILSCENQVVEIESSPYNSLSTEPNGMDALRTSKLSTNEFEQYNRYAELGAIRPQAEIGIQGRYDNGRPELDEGDESIEIGKESIDKFDNVMLEDSCILVHSKEFFSVPSRKGYQRSYKKKIQDAFASRMRSGKTKEYELLAMWYADIDAGADQQRLKNSIPCNLCRTLDSQSLTTDDSGESDWEIL